MSSNISELHYLLETGTSGIKTYQGGEAMGQRIKDWLANPEGSIADNPTWGNNLEALRFEPQNEITEISYGLAIISKMELDIQDLSILSIKVKYVSIDEISIVITDNHGEISTQLPIL